MKKEFHIASLSSEERKKLEKYEEELGKVLIAWDKDEISQGVHNKL